MAINKIFKIIITADAKRGYTKLKYPEIPESM
jgi:hypothetical protein